MKPKAQEALYIRNLPDGLKDLFKSACARRGLSMTKVIAALLSNYVNQKRSK